MSINTVANHLSERAMMVRLSIAMWTGRKHEPSVDGAVDELYGASQAGRFSKRLVRQEAISPVEIAAQAGRRFHYVNTLPWSDKGERVLPAANYGRYMAGMDVLERHFGAAVETFCVLYPALQADAAHRLGPRLFQQADYPADVRRKFAWEIEVWPFIDAGDFRVVGLGDSATERIHAEIQARVERTVQQAHADLYRRLAEGLGALADRLAEYRGVLRPELIENLRELCVLLPSLDIVGDPTLARFRADVEATVTRFSAPALRQDADLRDQTLLRARRIRRDLLVHVGAGEEEGSA